MLPKVVLLMAPIVGGLATAYIWNVIAKMERERQIKNVLIADIEKCVEAVRNSRAQGDVSFEEKDGDAIDPLDEMAELAYQMEFEE
ncbi:GL13100 [Drosophila persimilis]|uniref:GL13100 n=1 Tax=Drosophila persimilis TaxID=7234 RepID=B4GV57_DROPE|nr:GL13100 [Drosophila persimilis]